MRTKNRTPRDILKQSRLNVATRAVITNQLSNYRRVQHLQKIIDSGKFSKDINAMLSAQIREGNKIVHRQMARFALEGV